MEQEYQNDKRDNCQIFKNGQCFGYIIDCQGCPKYKEIEPPKVDKEIQGHTNACILHTNLTTLREYPEPAGEDVDKQVLSILYEISATQYLTGIAQANELSTFVKTLDTLYRRKLKKEICKEIKERLKGCKFTHYCEYEEKADLVLWSGIEQILKEVK